MTSENDIYDRLPEELKHDCSHCQSMCCVALKIDWPDAQKDQDVRCEFLDDEFQCKAWDRLEEIGRGQCRGFYCLNTGPGVCKPVFDASTNWLETPEIGPVLFDQFRRAYVATSEEIFGISPEVRNGESSEDGK